MKKSLKAILSPVIIAVTIVAFVYYLNHHPKTLAQLRHMSLPMLLGLIILYTIVFGAFAVITRASLQLYGKSMTPQENILFNAYSSLINFFGPGQSGPVFRGAYLKQRHQLRVTDYVFATLLYYAFYAVISVMCLLVGARPWWQTALAVVLAGVGSAGVIRWYRRRSHAGTHARFSLATISLVAGAAALQIAAMAAIYGVELHSVGVRPSLGQVLAYTGVANLTLFVSLTPAGIGIRESFLLFSERLHHINVSSIVAANLVDRAAYIVFLGVLFVLVVSLHAKDKLRIAQLKQP